MSFDVNEMLNRSREQAAQASALQEKIATLRGRAESPDGRVAVECTADDAFAALRIDPRAMRMGSSELSALIQEVARQARQDLQEQTSKVAAEIFGGANPVDMMRDREQLGRMLSDIQSTFTKATRDAEGLLSQFRGQMPR